MTNTIGYNGENQNEEVSSAWVINASPKLTESEWREQSGLLELDN